MNSIGLAAQNYEQPLKWCMISLFLTLQIDVIEAWYVIKFKNWNKESDNAKNFTWCVQHF